MSFTDDDDFSAIPVMKAGSGIEVVPLASVAVQGDPVALASLVLGKSEWREMRDDLRVRFVDIVAAYFRNATTVGMVREGCVRAKEKGGLGMSPVEADAVMDAIRAVESARPRQAPVVTPVPAVTPASIPPLSKRATPPVRAAVLTQAAALLDAGTTTKEIPATFPAKETPAPLAPSTPKAQAPQKSAPPRIPPPPMPRPAPAVPSPRASQAPVMAPPPAATPPAAQQQSTLPKSREEAIVLLVNEVMGELALRFPDRYLEDRLRSAIAARLRDIRDWQETEETLLRPAQSGGIGLSAAEAARVQTSLESRVARIQSALYTQQKSDVLAALAKERAANEARQTQRAVAGQQELDTLYTDLTGTASAQTQKTAAPLSRPAGGGAPRAPQTHAASVSSATPAPQRSLSMTDVRAPSVLVGPVEELRRMTVGDFRKLSTDPVEATKKIVDKLKLLETESFAKRFAGIAAFKESEVCTLYYTMSRTALMKGVSIAQVIADRTADTLPVLTASEFNAILTLNQMLRF